MLLLLKQRSRTAALFVFAASALAYLPAAVSQTAPVGPTLPVKTLTAGMHRIQSEVASTDASRSRGLMFRKELAPNHGMLFVFDQANVQCFWMRNTLTALTAAFVDEDGTIVNLEDMKPMSDDSHCSKKPVRFVLEMNQGWFAKRNIQAGFKLSGPAFTK